VHVDASLVIADVSWESLAVRHIEAVAEANEDAIEAERTSAKAASASAVSGLPPWSEP
jgi:hypothetical protein